MKLEEAINASSIGAAAIPAVEDIIYFRDGSSLWWLQTSYIDRGKKPGPSILESDDWHPFEGNKHLTKETIDGRTRD